MVVQVRALGWVALASAWMCVACSSHHGRDGSEAAGSGAMAGASGAAAIELGATANIVLEPVGSDPGDHPVDGKGTFGTVVAGVDFTLMMRGCMDRKPLPMFIMDGADCSPATLAGPRWDGARGEGLPSVSCIGNSNTGRAATTRAHDADKPWTIGGPPASDLVGHALVLFDAERQQPLACGVIMRGENAPQVPPLAPGEGPPVEIRAQLAGICLSTTFAPTANNDCPNPAELAKCADEHCGLAACAAQCTDYTACLEGLDDPCKEMFSCSASDDCLDCQLDVNTCVFSFCTEQIACAPPATPDGPCAQLEACCGMQGDEAPRCLDLVKALEKLSGDVSCHGVMLDWDTAAHLPVPCDWE